MGKGLGVVGPAVELTATPTARPASQVLPLDRVEDAVPLEMQLIFP